MVNGIWGRSRTTESCKEVNGLHSSPFIAAYSLPKYRETFLWQQGQYMACLITLGIMQSRECYRAIIVASDPCTLTISTQA